jgi:outer membrane scaffolding protein for murein synthesis (MipA/OmpV family)
MITGPVTLMNNRACRLAAAMFMMTPATPVFADVVAPVGILPTPIVVPPFVIPPDPNAGGEGLAPNRVLVAAGAAVVSDYEGSNHYSLTPIAGGSARVHGHAIVWNGNSVGFDLVPEYRNQTFKFIVAPYVDLNLNRVATPHDPVVALLPKLKLAVEGGGVIGFVRTGILTSKYDSLTVQVSAAHDLGSVHRSFVVTPSIGYVAPLSKAALVSAAASFDVAGAGYARYYFGIDSAESAASGLPLYRPGGGIKSANLGLGGALSLHGDLRKGFAVGMRLNYERLMGGFANSPIVAMQGNPNQFSATLGLAYIF